MFLQRSVPPALAPFIEGIWYAEGCFAHERERVLPTTFAQVLINVHRDELCSYEGERVQRTGGAVLSGARSRPMVIDTAAQRAILGVSFRPGGARAFFGPLVRDASDQNVPLDALWGRPGAVLRERLLDAQRPESMLAVLEQTMCAQRTQPAQARDVQRALAMLTCGAPVSAVIAALGMDTKRFIRRFEEHVGLTPKRFARVARFGRLLDALAVGRERSWAALAVRHGYFDQAHLIREFHLLGGTTPTRYAPRSPDAPLHVPL